MRGLWKKVVFALAFVFFAFVALSIKNFASEKKNKAWNAEISNFAKFGGLKFEASVCAFVRSSSFDGEPTDFSAVLQDSFSLCEGIAETNLLPVPCGEYLFVVSPELTCYGIKLIQRGAGKVFELSQDKEFEFLSVTYPKICGGKIEFFYLAVNSSKKIYRLCKTVFDGDNFQNSTVFEGFLRFDADMKVARHPASFFFCSDDFFCVSVLANSEKTGEKTICKFDMGGNLIESFDGSIIAPNPFCPNRVFYLAEFEKKEKMRIVGKYGFFDSSRLLKVFDKPVVQANYIAPTKLFVVTYDTDLIERFDFANGPWPPCEEAWIVDLENDEWNPCFFKHPWRKGNFFERANIRDASILLIPTACGV